MISTRQRARIAKPLPQPRVRRSSPFARFLSRAILVLLILVIIPVLLVFFAYGYFQYFGIIYPDVQIGDIDLQGLTFDEAVAKIDRTLNAGASITLVDSLDPGRTWTIDPAELGLVVDAHASAFEAYSLGNQSNLIDGVLQMLIVMRDGWQAPPTVVLNMQTARAWLDEQADQLYIAPQDATLSLEGTAALQTPCEEGQFLDSAATLALLADDPAATLLEYGFIPLIIEPIEATIVDVSVPVAELQEFLGAEIILRAYDPVTGEYFDWSPPIEVIASWLQVDLNKDGYSVVLMHDRVEEYLMGLNADLGDERSFDFARALENVLGGFESQQAEMQILHYEPRSYIPSGSESLISISFKVGIPYWKLEEVNPDVARRGLIPGEEIVVPPRDAMLPLPIIVDKRVVISISEQHMWLYENGELLREHVISTGISNSPTMPGIFQIQSRYLNAYASNWDLYMPHFLGIYEAVPGFMNGIHGLPTLSSGVRLWANVLGSPASYGCIILDLEAGEKLYNWAEDGVVVEIQR
jgi:hypothetical protein